MAGAAPASRPRALASLLDGKRYAIFVSTIEPRKNHRTIYNAWARCIEQGLIDPETCRLVFVGRVGWAIDDLLLEMETNPLTENTIVRLTDLADADLAGLYRDAEFGLFPSFYEGYGLPVAELLNHGKACLSSRSGSLEEVGGQAVDYIDPLDVLGWAEALARMFNDPEARAALEARVAEHYRPITWDDAAVLFLERLKGLR
jgi:glycosyltransferase involved in cell wall biosynthesis